MILCTILDKCTNPYSSNGYSVLSLPEAIVYGLLVDLVCVHWKDPQSKLKAHSQVWDVFDNWKPFKNDEKCVSFHFKRSCSFQIFKFLSWSFGLVGKMAWFERSG